MYKVCVLTATRAEYGILYPVLKQIKADDQLQLQLIVSGTHLLEEYGYTVNEIIGDGFDEFEEIEIIRKAGLSNSNTSGTSDIMAVAIKEYSGYLHSNRPDMGIILGDRYEMLAFAIALSNERIPIGHICGGETTEGVLDEAYRHAITKFSMFHFVNCYIHRKRVIQMGESPDRVYDVGDTCIDNIVSTKLLDKIELEHYLGREINNDLIIVTFHPITLSDDSIEQLEHLLTVMDHYDRYFYLITKANADKDGESINARLEVYANGHVNCMLVESLGRVRYLSFLSHAVAVVGNSSSGLYEAPHFNIPTINIGDRQKGRIHGVSVLDCGSEEQQIFKAFKRALSEEFSRICRNTKNIFGDGHTSEKIVSKIKENLINGIDIKKKFYDVEFEVR